MKRRIVATMTVTNVPPPQAPQSTAGQPPGRTLLTRALWWGGWIAATAVVVGALALCSRRAGLAPLIAGDNAYIFLAADRLYHGEGLTTTPPLAPFQAWEWRGDWVFLTQWPAGYPLLLCLARFVLGTTTASAGVALGVLACGVAIVAWFAWIRACLPRRAPAALVALVAAGATFSVANIVNPASDTLLVAATPLVLLLARRALRWHHADGSPRNTRGVMVVSLGLAAGTLFWLRYAAVFVALAVGIFLIIEWLAMKRATFREVLLYGLSAAAPLAALIMLNRTFGDAVSTQEQLNLGQRISLDLRPEMFVRAWTLFTRQTLYAHRPEAPWFFALVLPAAGLFLPLLGRESRRSMTAFLRSPAVLLSAVMVLTLLFLLITASALFQSKYNYVGLPRYYQPVKPLYFLLFVGPVLTFRPRLLRALACVPLVLACSWFVNQDAGRTLNRWLAQERPVTAYGRWARYFEPNSRRLYSWLARRGADDLVVFSNFHDEIALETHLPACPTPRDRDQLRAWMERIRLARGTADVDVLFVLEPGNGVRDYFLPPTEEIISRFNLVHPPDAPADIAPYVFVPAADENASKPRAPHASKTPVALSTTRRGEGALAPCVGG